MSHREGFHYGPCSTASGGALRLLLLAAVIVAVLFWPTVVTVATTVALIVKLTLLTLAVLAVLAAVAAIAIAVRRRSAPSASLVAVEPEREQRIEAQLAALTAAVERLERDRHPALGAPTHVAVFDPGVLAALASMAKSTGRSPALPEGWDAR
jgi:hypothetical protein